MPAWEEKQKRDDSRYDQMSTGELEQFLCLDFQASKEGASDVEAILHISHLLAQRKGISHWGAAWERLQTEYLPCTDGRSLYEWEEKEERTRDAEQKRPPRVGSHPIWRKVIALALVMMGPLLSGVVAVQATGINILEVIATWTDETFQLAAAGIGEDGADQTPQMEDLLPTWHPEGFVPGAPEMTETSDCLVLRVPYRGEDRTYTAEVRQLFTLEIDDDLRYPNGETVDIYEGFNRMFYIYTDGDEYMATSYDGEFWLCIRGMLTIEEIKGVLDSIQGPLSRRNEEWMRNLLAECGQTLYYPQIPEGLVSVQADIQVLDQGMETEWITWTDAYAKGDLFLGFVMHKRAMGSDSYYEKDDGPVEEYVYHGITHYIFTNLDFTTVVWMAGDVEYSMMATRDAFDIKALIRSAYEER